MDSNVFKNEAIHQCMKSTYKKPMGAVVVYKGKIVGRGCNKVHSTGIPRLDGKHAEREALNNTTAKYRKDSTIYVCRLAKDGSLALAKPCSACYTVMKKMGVKYVWYSSYGDWVRMTF
jgi:tRNA(Arg) A34 adenosine deaminase TadA